MKREDMRRELEQFKQEMEDQYDLQVMRLEAKQREIADYFNQRQQVLRRMEGDIDARILAQERAMVGAASQTTLAIEKGTTYMQGFIHDLKKFEELEEEELSKRRTQHEQLEEYKKNVMLQIAEREMKALAKIEEALGEAIKKLNPETEEEGDGTEHSSNS